MIKKISLWILILALCMTLIPLTAFAEGEPYALTVMVNGTQKLVRAYDNTYTGNVYLSLTDLAAAQKSSSDLRELSPPRMESTFQFPWVRHRFLALVRVDWLRIRLL